LLSESGRAPVSTMYYAAYALLRCADSRLWSVVAGSASRAARPLLKPSTSTLRAFPMTFHIQSGGPPPPQLYGDGGQAGSVPTDMEQA
jgi:hypothetical protein